MDPAAYEIIKEAHTRLVEAGEDLTQRDIMYVTIKLEDLVKLFAEPQPMVDDRPWWQRIFNG